MADLHAVQYDKETGQFVTKQAGVEVRFYEFDIPPEGGQAFMIQPFLLTTPIKVSLNGVLCREGATQTWQRDVDNNIIFFNNSIPGPGWVLIEVW